MLFFVGECSITVKLNLMSTAFRNKAIFLDRDGTLIDARIENNQLRTINNISDLRIKKDARKTLKTLKHRGYKLILITNQPDVYYGIISKNFVRVINHILKIYLNLDLIKVTYVPEHIDSFRYKPNPGMLYEARDELDLDFSKSYVVGDRWRDVNAGINVGSKTIHLKSQSIEPLKNLPDYTILELKEILNIAK